MKEVVELERMYMRKEIQNKRHAMKTENTPSQDTIATGETIELQTRFGGLSRGKCWGKCYPGKTRPTGDFEWVEKHNGTLYLTQPGFYIVGSGDGFTRQAKADFVLKA